jgi:hypothetical protein
MHVKLDGPELRGFLTITRLVLKGAVEDRFLSEKAGLAAARALERAEQAYDRWMSAGLKAKDLKLRRIAGPCRHCGRAEHGGGWYKPCPAEDCPSHDKGPGKR